MKILRSNTAAAKVLPSNMRQHRSERAGPAMRDFTGLAPDRYLRAPSLAQLLGVSQATVWRWSAAGRLPRPIRLGPAVTAWSAREVAEAVERIRAAGERAQ